MGSAEVACLVFVLSSEPHPSTLCEDPDSWGAMAMCVGMWILLLALHAQGKPRKYTPSCDTYAPYFIITSSCVCVCVRALRDVLQWQTCFTCEWVVRCDRPACVWQQDVQTSEIIYWKVSPVLKSSPQNGCRILMWQQNIEVTPAAGRWRYARMVWPSSLPSFPVAQCNEFSWILIETCGLSGENVNN